MNLPGIIENIGDAILARMIAVRGLREIADEIEDQTD